MVRQDRTSPLEICLSLTRIEHQTVYNVWKPADGVFKSENITKYIHFVSKRSDKLGWVKVVGGSEGYASNTLQKFEILADCEFEVLSCNIMFTQF